MEAEPGGGMYGCGGSCATGYFKLLMLLTLLALLEATLADFNRLSLPRPGKINYLIVLFHDYYSTVTRRKMLRKNY